MEWKKGARTDLAVEALELGQGAEPMVSLFGVRHRELKRCGIPINEVEILDDTAAQQLGKPVGHYLTLTLGELPRRTGDTFERAVQAVTETLMGLLPVGDTLPALVIGLGNRDITPDAIGPIAMDHTLATRHLVGQASEYFSQWRPVAAVRTGVVGSTGVESAELIRALTREIKPAFVIAVDALAARSAARLGKTIQIADTGIIPGSGVGNARAALNQETLGVPVIAMGVPTVVDAGTLVSELAGQEVTGQETLEQMMVTPREIDSLAADLGRVVGYAISLALQKGLALADLELLLS